MPGVRRDRDRCIGPGIDRGDRRRSGDVAVGEALDSGDVVGGRLRGQRLCLRRQRRPWRLRLRHWRIGCLQSADFGLDRLNDLLPPDLKFRRDDTWRKARERERH
jgi:hypothetical protein